MGQQQLLLLVLGIVIVGLAVVVGIQAFGENQKKSQHDRQIGETVALAGEVIAWYQKPTASGGAGAQGSNITRAKLTMQALGRPQNYTDGDRTGNEASNFGLYMRITSGRPILEAVAQPFGIGSTITETIVFGPHPECIVSQQGMYGLGGFDHFATTPPANPDAAKCRW